MATNTYKLTTLVGESSEGIEDAVRTALATSATKVHGQSWCQITDLRASIGDNGQVDLWQVQLEVGFKIDE